MNSCAPIDNLVSLTSRDNDFSRRHIRLTKRPFTPLFARMNSCAPLTLLFLSFAEAMTSVVVIYSQQTPFHYAIRTNEFMRSINTFVSLICGGDDFSRRHGCFQTPNLSANTPALSGQPQGRSNRSRPIYILSNSRTAP